MLNKWFRHASNFCGNCWYHFPLYPTYIIPPLYYVSVLCDDNEQIIAFLFNIKTFNYLHYYCYFNVNLIYFELTIIVVALHEVYKGAHNGDVCSSFGMFQIRRYMMLKLYTESCRANAI
jgi:hypothetical protein